MSKEIKSRIRPNCEYKFFVYDPYGHGMVFFETEDDAIKASRVFIEDYLDVGEWLEGVDRIIIGNVTHMSVRTNVIKRPSDSDIDEAGFDTEENYWGDDYEEKCNFLVLKI